MADLGRPWRPYASVTYINCTMGDHIKPEGWDNWGNVENKKTAPLRRVPLHGPGCKPKPRVGLVQATDEWGGREADDLSHSGRARWLETRARTATAAP